MRREERPAGKTEEEPEMGKSAGRGNLFQRKVPFVFFPVFHPSVSEQGSIRRAFLWDIAFLHYFPQCAGEPVVFLGETDGGAEPCSVVEHAVVGTVAHGDPETPQQDAVQVFGGASPAEQHVVGGGGEHLHAGEAG